MFRSLRIKVQLGIGFAVVVGLFAFTLLVVGVLLSRLTQSVRQLTEESLPFVLVVDEMDLSRSEVQQFLTDVSATHDRAGYKEADDSARRFHSGVDKFRQLYRLENDQSSLQQLDAGNLLMKGSDAAPGFDKNSETLFKGMEKFRKQQVTEANQISEAALDSANFICSA